MKEYQIMSTGKVREILTFPVGAALAPHLCVAVTKATGILGVATADDCLGVTTTRATASGQVVDVVPLNAGGSVFMTASAVIAIGVAVELEAGGKVIANVAGTIVGTALQAAAADGDIIEVLLNPVGMGVTDPA
jgi:hypothetical protein